jgi:hypothetical protein
MSTTNTIKTVNGKEVKQLTKVGDLYVGIVDGKTLTWNTRGKLSNGVYKSKNDLKLNSNYYVAIRKWGSTFKSTIYDKAPKGRGIVKVLEVSI